jgi:hypothetical protein
LRVEELEPKIAPAIFHVWKITDTPGQAVAGELRKAVNDAIADWNVNAGPNVVEAIDFLDPNNNMAALAGNIQLGAVLPNINFNFQIDGPGQGINVNGADTNKLTITAPKTGRVFTLTGANGTISGLKLEGGNVSGVGDNGGVISVAGGNLTLSKTLVRGGTAVKGGGIYSFIGNLTVNQCEISGNTAVVDNDKAGGLGGGICSDCETCKLNITQTYMEQNTAAIMGGAVFTHEVTTIDTSTIKYNSAQNGGGIAVQGIKGAQTLDITNSTIGNQDNAIPDVNGVGGNGGGIYEQSAVVTLTNTTVAGDQAVSGGGIYVDSGKFATKLVTKSTTICRNIATDNGGGVYIAGGTAVEPVNTAFVQNIAAAGSDVFGNVTTKGHNLITLSAGSAGWNAPNSPGGDIKDPAGGTNFGVLKYNGGPTIYGNPMETCMPDGNAIDKGDNAAVPAGLKNDQRGNGFPRIQNNVVDIGAVEVQPANNNPTPTAFNYYYTTPDGQVLMVGPGGGGNGPGAPVFAVVAVFPPQILVVRFGVAVFPPGQFMPLGGANAAIFGAAGVLTDDYSPVGNRLTAILDAAPANGAVTLNSDGSFVYTPDAGFDGTDSFTYYVTDGTYNSTDATVTIRVAGAPIAADQYYTTAAGQSLTLSTPGMLAGAYTPSGSPLTPVIDSQPQNGTVAVNQDGSFTYTPSPSFVGIDTFKFHATDGTLSSNIATVSINVGEVVAGGATYSTLFNQELTVDAPGLLGGNEVSNAPLTAVLNSQPTNGTVTLNSDGSFTYAPNNGFLGTDDFTYYVADGTYTSTVATVAINVQSPPPVVFGQYYSTLPGQNLTVSAASGVLANALSLTGAALSAIVASQAVNGVLTLNSDGSFIYAPYSGFTGIDSFSYYATDGINSSNFNTVVISVQNPAPVAYDQYYTALEGGALSVSAANGLLANAYSPTNSPLTAVLASQPGSGALTVNSDGSFTYTPAAGFTGIVTFTYYVTDDTNNSEIATVTLDIESQSGNA